MEPLLEDPGEFQPVTDSTPDPLSSPLTPPYLISNSNPSLNVTSKVDRPMNLSSSATCLNKTTTPTAKNQCSNGGSNEDLKFKKKTTEDRLKKAVGRVLIALTFKRKPDKGQSINKSNSHLPIGGHKSKTSSQGIVVSPLAGAGKLDQIPEVRVFGESNTIGSLEDLTLMNLARSGSRRGKWGAAEGDVWVQFSPQLNTELLSASGSLTRKEKAVS